jgi:hypothetical protein
VSALLVVAGVCGCGSTSTTPVTGTEAVTGMGVEPPIGSDAGVGIVKNPSIRSPASARECVARWNAATNTTARTQLVSTPYVRHPTRGDAWVGAPQSVAGVCRVAIVARSNGDQGVGTIWTESWSAGVFTKTDFAQFVRFSALPLAVTADGHLH